MICASPELSRDDLPFVPAYRVLRQQVGGAGQPIRKLQLPGSDGSSLGPAEARLGEAFDRRRSVKAENARQPRAGR
jgi:hypothetical protein